MNARRKFVDFKWFQRFRNHGYSKVSTQFKERGLLGASLELVFFCWLGARGRNHVYAPLKRPGKVRKDVGKSRKSKKFTSFLDLYGGVLKPRETKMAGILFADLFGLVGGVGTCTLTFFEKLAPPLKKPLSFGC